MKSVIKNVGGQFSPFTLEINVESEEDLRVLWLHFNAGKETLKRGYNNPEKYIWPDNMNRTDGIWEKLDNIRKEMKVLVHNLGDRYV